MNLRPALDNREVVLLGFGGPETSAEIRPFLNRVLAGRPIPQTRFEEVVRHYELIGGRSPFNELTQRQAGELQRELHARGLEVPVSVAFRNAAPFIEEVAQRLRREERQPIAVILAAQQSEAGWDRYYGTIPGARYTKPFYDHPLFVQAYAARIAEALQSLGRDHFTDEALILTAHSIPQAMADRGPYVQQLRCSAELIAGAARASNWRIAYQSRSGSPAEAWLEPDVRAVLRELPQSGVREAVIAPIGFLCDHVEVLYDLDIDAAGVARENGVRIARAGALNDHPFFIRMLADLVQQCLA